MSIDTVPDWPRIEAVTRSDGSGEVTINGTSHAIATSSIDAARTAIVDVVAATATKVGRPVRVATTGPDGDWPLIVHPDGTVESDIKAEASSSRGRRAVRQEPVEPELELAELETTLPPAVAEEPAPTSDPDPDPDPDPAPEPEQEPELNDDSAADPWVRDAIAETPTAPPAHRSAALGPAAQRPKRRATTTGEHAQVPNRIGERPSFITAGRAVQPAEQGWQGQLNKLGGRLAPGPSEVAYRDDVSAVAQHWPGLRTIAVANPKGSGNKTPTSICLAAQFALIGGTGVLAWDNNETRGSLPWRVDHTAHEATVLDLLPRVDALLGGDAQFYAEVGRYVHHQAGDKFDALFSDQSVDGAHVVSAQNVEDVYRVAARYYRLTIVDSGNSERAANWRVMIDRADRLVVPCTNVEDTAEAAARMLESLATRDEHSARLAREAVVIVSQRNPGPDANTKRIIGQFEDMGHEVVTIPYDPALVTGVIRHGQLRKATQRAWLSAAAAAARGL